MHVECQSGAPRISPPPKTSRILYTQSQNYSTVNYRHYHTRINGGQCTVELQKTILWRTNSGGGGDNNLTKAATKRQRCIHMTRIDHEALSIETKYDTLLFCFIAIHCRMDSSHELPTYIALRRFSHLRYTTDCTTANRAQSISYALGSIALHALQRRRSGFNLLVLKQRKRIKIKKLKEIKKMLLFKTQKETSCCVLSYLDYRANTYEKQEHFTLSPFCGTPYLQQS